MTIICIHMSSSSGDLEPCDIEFTQGTPIVMEARSKRFGVVSFTGDNLFDILSRLRLLIEREGYLLLCNAARRDAYPSRMTLEMGGGRKLYILRHGVQARREDLVDVFGAASIDQVCTVAEQRAGYESWLRSLK